MLWGHERAHGLASLPRWLSEPDTGTAAVFVDELDAGGLKRSSDHIERCLAWLTGLGFQLVHGDNANSRVSRQFRLTPLKQASGSPALAGGEHLRRVMRLSDSYNCIDFLLTRIYIYYIC